MKKIIFLLAVISLVPMNVYASADRVGQWDAGVNIAGNLISDDQGDGAVYLGGNFSYGVKEWMALGMSVGWSDSRFEVTNSAGSNGKGGRVALIPVFGDVIFRVPNLDNRQLVPYGVIGLGGIFANEHGNGNASALGLSTDTEDGIALKLGAGVDWFANNNWIYYLETGYVFTDASIEVKNPDGSDNDSISLDYYYIGGGIKWLA